MLHLSSGQNFLLQILMFMYPLLLTQAGPVHLESCPGFGTCQVHSGGCQFRLERNLIQPFEMMLAYIRSRTNNAVVAFDTPLADLRVVTVRRSTKFAKCKSLPGKPRAYPSVDKFSNGFPADSSKRDL